MIFHGSRTAAVTGKPNMLYLSLKGFHVCSYTYFVLSHCDGFQQYWLWHFYILASWPFWRYYSIFVGQAWVMFYDHDLGGRHVKSGMITADIEESRWPKTIDDCLAYCNQNPECKGVTYAYGWGKPFLRCFFKEASRWGTPSFITSSCCHHYELTRGHEGEETGSTLSVAFWLTPWRDLFAKRLFVTIHIKDLGSLYIQGVPYYIRC